jgi:hypothetical protein
MEKAYKSQTWLTRRYVIDGKTVTEIAEECKASPATITAWLLKFNLIKNPRSWK